MGNSDSKEVNGKCVVCSKTFGFDEMICLQDKWVCGECKSDFVQMLQEGVSMADITVARKKKTLVMGKNATLPDRCIKCNAPADGLRLKRNLYWHNPYIYLVIILHLLIYIIVSMCVRKRAKIEVGLCERHLNKRRLCIAATWFSILFSIGLTIMATVTNMIFLLIAGLVMLLVAIIYGSVTVPLVRPAKIDKEYVWLKGVCEEYLDELPEWVK